MSASAVAGAGVPKKSVKAAGPKNTLDATLPGSWIEIHPDNTILIRTGKSDFGQSTTFTAYRQIVAEELNAPFEAITTVVMGDTDRTPDGSGAFDFLGRGTPNIRKAAAYTYQALLDLASQRLGVPKSQLSVKDGVVSGGGKSMSYGDLVKGQQLKLTIPVSGDLTSIMGLTVTGNPPMKPVSEYTIIGKSFRNMRHRVQSHRPGEMGHRCAAARYAARAHGASEDAGLHAGVRGRIGQDPLPQRAGCRERQSCGCGCAHRMGSHPRRAAGGQRDQVDRVERAARQSKPVQTPERKTPIGKRRPSRRATRPEAM